MSVIAIHQDNFEKEVLQSDRRVLLDFYADWCGPCRILSPIVEEIAREHPEYKVCKLNVDEETLLAGAFEIMSIPTLLVFEKGKVIAKSLGAKPKAQVLALLESHE
ncbi:MAG: thioredoxin [Clostridia bacterium]|nr:thioredoxin [Clostridia bacterium]